MPRTKKELQLLKQLGKQIQKEREAQGISQQELASMCDFEKSNMSRLEAGNTNPTYLTLLKIAMALEISVNDLIP